ncbi:hypothetical protein C8J57DRAFT_1464845, partial [Mycena rebaudengoi]
MKRAAKMRTRLDSGAIIWNDNLLTGSSEDAAFIISDNDDPPAAPTLALAASGAPSAMMSHAGVEPDVPAAAPTSNDTKSPLFSALNRTPSRRHLSLTCQTTGTIQHTSLTHQLLLPLRLGGPALPPQSQATPLPFLPHLGTWLTLLGRCQHHRHRFLPPPRKSLGTRQDLVAMERERVGLTRGPRIL